MPETPVLDSQMYYEDLGQGRSVVFLHGNPTSSYLWRSVIPEMSDRWRCLAPDLIGMGRSGKPDIGYRFADHARYLDAWFDRLDLDRVVLVGHDWGGALGFDWAARHPERVAALAFMETIVRTFTWDDFPESGRGPFQAMRQPGEGEKLVLEQNLFLDTLLPALTLRTLTPQELDVYRAPYPHPADRRPILAWPREIPIDGEPADVARRVQQYGAWLGTSPQVPKLLLTFDPGAIMTPPTIEWCRQNIAALEIRHIGPGSHYVQEDQGPAIGTTIDSWLAQLPS
ncbi:haloalkane dehalogenase [Streptomyces sp. NPDC001165]|uniref:haloalkane dehalogenase n=1 Tax=Streptomyces sp. NPDC001165 TaxID=3364546 RepID=UPI00368AC816